MSLTLGSANKPQHSARSRQSPSPSTGRGPEHSSALNLNFLVAMLTSFRIKEAQQAILDEVLLNPKKRLSAEEKRQVKNATAAGMAGKRPSIGKGECLNLNIRCFQGC